MTRQHYAQPGESPTGRPRHSQTLPRVPESAAAARRTVRTVLTAWGHDDLIEDALVIVTELVADAVGYGRMGTLRVIASRPTERFIRVGVVDRSKTLPTLRLDSGEDGTGGRGLVLVDELGDRWGTDLYRWGKQVWAELRTEVKS